MDVLAPIVFSVEFVNLSLTWFANDDMPRDYINSSIQF